MIRLRTAAGMFRSTLPNGLALTACFEALYCGHVSIGYSPAAELVMTTLPPGCLLRRA